MSERYINGQKIELDIQKDCREAIEQELKPCPFCGGRATWRTMKKRYCQLHGEDLQDRELGCHSSKCDVKPTVFNPAEIWSILQWNTRKEAQEK